MRRLFLQISFVVTSILLVTLTQGATAKSKFSRTYYEALGVVWDVHTKEKMIALTFDDGPNQLYTPQILDVLKQYGAKSTFFVNGNQVKKFPELVRRQVREGHELGNHTTNHGKIWKMTKEQILQEIAGTEEAIISATGQKPPKLFRPPSGYIDPTVVSVVKDAGYSYVLWSFHLDTQDWKRPGVGKIVSKVVNGARRGNIVLFHDHGGNRKQTVRALKRILPILKKRGYRFVTVSELVQEANLRELHTIHRMD
ncbi:polysaccharide deacetylase family protein [Brevibacillus reuszeri]|uniref:polysaccharide deacetylase family protein n=1 Tax=Brevibacillus reuszeri TaxID=54915 RepID=UPI0028A0F322|nr:polysaccharide deacetylase family protein [Brevibacillus reuszeri]